MLVLKDESGFSLVSPLKRTWSPRGQTPVTRTSLNAYTSLPNGSWFTATKADTNEFLDVTMNDCQVQLNAIDQNGIVFDTYTINRCGTPSLTFSPTPTYTATNTVTASNTPTDTPHADSYPDKHGDQYRHT
jgi:hypothetical protein